MGIADVEEFLTQDRSSRLLDFWMAYDRIEPIGEQWLQTAQVCQTLSQGHGYQLGCHGQKHEIKSFDHFMPKRWRQPRELKKGRKSSSVSVHQARSRLEQRFGA